MEVSECRRHFDQGGVDDRPGAGVPRGGGRRAAAIDESRGRRASVNDDLGAASEKI